MPHGTACSYCDPIDETAIGFDERKKPFVLLRQFKTKQFAAIQAHAYSKDLPWA